MIKWIFAWIVILSGIAFCFYAVIDLIVSYVKMRREVKVRDTEQENDTYKLVMDMPNDPIDRIRELEIMLANERAANRYAYERLSDKKIIMELKRAIEKFNESQSEDNFINLRRAVFNTKLSPLINKNKYYCPVCMKQIKYDQEECEHCKQKFWWKTIKALKEIV